MPFTITLGFATEHDRDDFAQRAAPKFHARPVDAPPAPEGDSQARFAVEVTSPSAAREVCHQLVAFLAKAKNSRVTLAWTGADGETHAGEVNAGAARDAETVAVRLAAAAKAWLDKEKP